MVACGGCATESPDGFRFCPVCGLPLPDAPAADLPAAAWPAKTASDSAVIEERRVVTALFCDLVGFTAASETADPEDVDR
ncbi:MAG TPA: hypothetical protein VF114_07705, partial [Candidatus Limnocylindria bacterium]